MENKFQPEYEVIGSLLINPENFEDVSSRLLREDFFSSQCRSIFSAMESLSQERIEIDMATVLSRLKDENRELARFLENETPTDKTLPYWIRRVKEDSLRRQITDEANKGPDMDCEKIERLSYQMNSLKNIEATGQWIEDIPSLEENPSAIIKTGFKIFDRHFPLRAPRMIIVAGATGQGKTSFLLQAAYNISKERRVGVISIERTAQEIRFRIVKSFKALPPRERFFVEAPGQISSLKMKSIIRGLKNKGVEIVMIDFLQLMKETDRFATRHLEVSHIIRCLKDFNKEFDLPMIVVSTISRRDERSRPTLSLLKESGDLEFAADAVVFIFEPKPGDDDYKKEYEKRGVKLFILEKNLWGPRGDIPMIWNEERTYFSEYKEPSEDKGKSSFGLEEIHEPGEGLDDLNKK